MINTDPARQAPAYVHRHPTSDTSEFTVMLDEQRGLLVASRNSLPGRPQSTRCLYRDSLIEAALLQRVQPNSPEILVAFRRAGRAVAACCDLVSSDEGLVLLDIMDGPVILPRCATNTLIAVADFVDGFYAALAANDTTTLGQLVTVDLQTLRMTGAVQKAYLFHWARALQGFALGASWAVESCAAAVHDAAQESPRNGPGGAAYMFFKASRDMSLMMATTWDPKTFSASLLRSLESHRHYIEEIEIYPGEDQSDNPLGFIALGPTAFAAAMSRRGWPVNVESDYLPRCALKV